MGPNDFLKELSKYEIDIRRPGPRKRDTLTLTIALVALGLGIYLLFRDGADLDALGGGVLILAAVWGAASSRGDVSYSEGPGKGGDPNDTGSDTTVITLHPKPKKDDE